MKGKSFSNLYPHLYILSITSLLLFIVAFIVPTAASQPVVKEYPKQATIGTFPGSILAVTKGLCGFIKEEMGISAEPKMGTSSIKEAQFLNNGEVDVTVCQIDVTIAAIHGKAMFKETGRMPIRALCTLHPTIIHLATWAGSGIKSVPDVRGKRFNFEKPGTPGLTLFAETIMEFHGMTRDDVTVLSHLNPPLAMNALRKKTTDLLAHPGPLGGSSLWMGLTMRSDINFIPLTEAEQNYIIKKAPYLLKVTLPAGTYKGQDKDLHSVGMQLLYIAHRDTNDDFVYQLCKVLFDDVGPDKTGRFTRFHKDSGAFTLNRGLLSAGKVPLHAGAVKYFRDRGVWTDEFEKKQQMMLKELGEAR